MKSNGILIFYHLRANSGFAIGRHEPDFFQMAEVLTGDINKIHLGYPSYEKGFPSYVNKEFNNFIQFNSGEKNKKQLKELYRYIKNNNIDVAFGFDQPVSCPAYSAMRDAGIKLIVSYWGAPMSSKNHGIKLFLKKMEVKFRRNKPDHYIFQSKAMANLAVNGRGISSKEVSIIYNAVDTDIFKPDILFKTYACRTFDIPLDRKIVFYSGHMEERKGVHIIIEAANELIRSRGRKDVHFLLLGNEEGQEKRFGSRYLGTETEKYITFGGYREDINRIIPSCYLGIIASTGWDSLTMSSVEIASSGLPLIVSDLQGLAETVENGKTGYRFPPGNYISLADKIERLLDNPELQKELGSNGRQRAIVMFSKKTHMDSLVKTMQRLYLEAARKENNLHFLITI